LALLIKCGAGEPVAWRLRTIAWRLRVLFEHFAAATAALISRAAGGRGYGRADPDLQIAKPRRGERQRSRLPALLGSADFVIAWLLRRDSETRRFSEEIMPQKHLEPQSIQFETIAL